MNLENRKKDEVKHYAYTFHNFNDQRIRASNTVIAAPEPGVTDTRRDRLYDSIYTFFNKLLVIHPEVKSVVNSNTQLRPHTLDVDNDQFKWKKRIYYFTNDSELCYYVLDRHNMYYPVEYKDTKDDEKYVYIVVENFIGNSDLPDNIGYNSSSFRTKDTLIRNNLTKKVKNMFDGDDKSMYTDNTVDYIVSNHSNQIAYKENEVKRRLNRWKNVCLYYTNPTNITTTESNKEALKEVVDKYCSWESNYIVNHDRYVEAEAHKSGNISWFTEDMIENRYNNHMSYVSPGTPYKTNSTYIMNTCADTEARAFEYECMFRNTLGVRHVYKIPISVVKDQMYGYYSKSEDILIVPGIDFVKNRILHPYSQAAIDLRAAQEFTNKIENLTNASYVGSIGIYSKKHSNSDGYWTMLLGKLIQIPIMLQDEDGGSEHIKIHHKNERNETIVTVLHLTPENLKALNIFKSKEEAMCYGYTKENLETLEYQRELKSLELRIEELQAKENALLARIEAEEQKLKDDLVRHDMSMDVAANKYAQACVNNAIENRKMKDEIINHIADTRMKRLERDIKRDKLNYDLVNNIYNSVEREIDHKRTLEEYRLRGIERNIEHEYKIKELGAKYNASKRNELLDTVKTILDISWLMSKIL